MESTKSCTEQIQETGGKERTQNWLKLYNIRKCFEKIEPERDALGGSPKT